MSNTFVSQFGQESQVTARAPGRVNLIGEHTDYNDGFVLPTTIPQETTVQLTRREGPEVRAYAADLDRRGSYTLGGEAHTGSWIDYLQGVTQELTRDGHELGGFDVRLSSEVPLGSGLSSSAALLVALLRGLRELFSLQIDDVEIARLARRAENGLVGANVGIMDQMACSLAREGEALFLDCRDLSFERVPLPRDVDLVVLHSGVEHQHAGGDYNTRRAECERACELLGVASLRDLPLGDLLRVEALPEPLGRRARHVVTENARVLEAVAAIRSGDLAKLGELFFASHASMRDDYEVSIAEVDLIVELAREQQAVYGARLTGGGFGGSVVMLARLGEGRRVGGAIADEYARRSGRTPKLLTPAAN
ncbi:galactokinase [Deinococcus peraridilitoris]|uniref:Galactokinase n=1 Tax=Deinococcus peraridilitoris (strain DSM 19664 / LMG 22246 / CIP 109416 / KR-200) TaxID=937777 RepID=K9ZYW4_DEIPD|nr:galactokinase [Deinococcus peraridilitoris]AFZ65950.1 galactokinase [Deinococcus peraridilitoris DSM 19664]